ncbi:MAG TPA: ATP-binding protein, partial [Proteobacteria bacterium]|nr:ATP-binding protein [Pseudomonadota bacterium]
MAEQFELPFKGREREMTALMGILDRPNGEAVIVSGKPGIGKSRLLERFGQEAFG